MRAAVRLRVPVRVPVRDCTPIVVSPTALCRTRAAVRELMHLSRISSNAPLSHFFCILRAFFSSETGAFLGCGPLLFTAASSQTSSI